MSATPAKDPPDAAADARVRIEEVGLDAIDVIRELNQAVFDEERIINTFDREDLTIYLARVEGEPAGFKIGYRQNRFVYYSAKGGVLPEYRRRGIARRMLRTMMEEARRRGYIRFTYDTFPNRDKGMTVLGLNEGFRVVKADFNKTYRDWRLRLETRL